MKILQICHKVPFPPADGGCIAMNNLTQGLMAQGHLVKVLAIATPKHNVNISDLPAEYRKATNIETVFVNTSVKPLSAFCNLFTAESYNISRFYSSEFEEKIVTELKNNKYDVVQLESLFVSMYVPAIRKYSNAKIVLRSHNIEYKIWERNADTEKSFLKKNYFSFLAGRLKKYELHALDLYDAVIPISKEDAEWFTKNNFKKPKMLVPFGIDDDKLTTPGTSLSPEKRSLFHIGAMDWYPNLEGINWFLDNVWEKVNSRFPDVKLYLAGRKIDQKLISMKNNVLVVGEVENAYDFMRSKGLMIVPLLSGGGMRVKLIEGMGLGKVVLSTSVGAEGLEYTNKKNILIADSVDDFITAISSYLNDKDYLGNIGINAQQLIKAKYSNTVICKDLSAFYSELIK